ncbi:MAG: altronate dehydratase family protein [Pirellulales bacterium]|nr:altronate dehydratase family protein [Pirellulales bacterium]
MPTLLHLHPDDPLAVATRDLVEGERVAVAEFNFTIAENIPAGHKVALVDLPEGAPVKKFGQYIGTTTTEICRGDWIHSPNLTAGKLAGEHELATAIPPDPTPLTGKTFLGYPRPGGRAGTRNYLAVISSVNCSATVAKRVAAHFTRERLAAYPNVDGVVAFTHGHGCGIEFRGEFHRLLNRVLGGMAKHPNIGGYLLIGLGCETVTPGALIEDAKLVQVGDFRGSAKNDAAVGETNTAKTSPTPSSQPASYAPPVLVMQNLGGTQNTIRAGIALVEQLLPRVNAFSRQPCPASQIILGTNCGGSDGNSGITANAALGHAADMLVAAGGTVILAETTEIYGAEQLLTRRARTPAVGQKLLDRIRWWEWYAGMYGCTPDNNPSPGNKAGGLTTIYEKSLGAIIKGGTTALNAVYEYAEQVTERGLVVMDTPGLDPVSVTGIVAGGANLVAFTTGRGSCFGFKPSPVLKIASNTPMYLRMQADMDINAGDILHGKPVNEVGQEIFQALLDLASGKPSKSEAQDLGTEEFQPWMLGPTL